MSDEKITSLPKLSTPTYETTLPSSGKKIKYRPYLVKEERLLLIASESDDADETSIMNQIVSNCTFGKLNIFDLEGVDLEWLLLQIRIKAKGADAEIVLECSNKLDDDSVCGHRTTTTVDLNKAIKCKTLEDTDKVIMFEDEIGVKMRALTFKEIEEIESSLNTPTEILFEKIVRSIDMIFFGEDVWKSSEVTREALYEFVDNLREEYFAKLFEFVNTTSAIAVEIDFECEKCKFKDTIKFTDLDDFFTYL